MNFQTAFAWLYVSAIAVCAHQAAADGIVPARWSKVVITSQQTMQYGNIFQQGWIQAKGNIESVAARASVRDQPSSDLFKNLHQWATTAVIAGSMATFGKVAAARCIAIKAGDEVFLDLVLSAADIMRTKAES